MVRATSDSDAKRAGEHEEGVEEENIVEKNGDANAEEKADDDEEEEEEYEIEAVLEHRKDVFGKVCLSSRRRVRDRSVGDCSPAPSLLSRFLDVNYSQIKTR